MIFLIQCFFINFYLIDTDKLEMIKQWNDHHGNNNTGKQMAEYDKHCHGPIVIYLELKMEKQIKTRYKNVCPIFLTLMMCGAFVVQDVTFAKV